MTLREPIFGSTQVRQVGLNPAIMLDSDKSHITITHPPPSPHFDLDHNRPVGIVVLQFIRATGPQDLLPLKGDLLYILPLKGVDLFLFSSVGRDEILKCLMLQLCVSMIVYFYAKLEKCRTK